MLYVALIVLLGVSFKYKKDYNKRLWLILCIFLIFCFEITNTSIEAVVNRISLHPWKFKMGQKLNYVI